MKGGIGVRLKQFSPYEATDRIKIRSDQKCLFFAVSLYPLSFFANTPFKKLTLYRNTHCNTTSTQMFHKITYKTIILARRAIKFWT